MTRLLDTDVRFISNVEATAKLMNEWGSLTQVLDEVLTVGSNEQQILSITTIEDPEDSRYWLSTIVLNTGHKFEKELHVVSISGVSVNEYNNVFRVQETTQNSINIAFLKETQIEKPLDVVNTAEAKIKLAPLGYEIVFTDTNKRVYKSKNPNANICYLRVDDSCPLGYDPSWLKFARVSMYSEIESIDDFYPKQGRLKAPYYVEDPVRAEVPSGTGPKGRYGESKWYYSSRTDWDNYGENSPPTFAGPREYEFIGDSKTFYFFNSLESYYVGNQRIGRCFGEYLDIDSVNNVNNHILCSHEWPTTADNTYWNGRYINHYGGNPGRWESTSTFSRLRDSWGKYILNNEQSLDVLQNHVKVEFTNSMTGNLSGRDTGYSFNQYTLNLNFFEVYIRAFFPNKTVFKGKMRGYYFIGNNLQDFRSRIPEHKQIITDIRGNDCLKFLMLSSFQNWSGNNVEWDGWQYSRVAFKLNNWE